MDIQEIADCSYCLTRPAIGVDLDGDNICDDCSDPTVRVCEACDGQGLVSAGHFKGREMFDDCPDCGGHGVMPKENTQPSDPESH